MRHVTTCSAAHRRSDFATQTPLPTLSDQAGSSCMRETCYCMCGSAACRVFCHLSCHCSCHRLMGLCHHPHTTQPDMVAARVCHRSDPHASVTARGLVSPTARVTIRTQPDMVARRTCLSPLRSARPCHRSWTRIAHSSYHHPHSTGYGRP